MRYRSRCDLFMYSEAQLRQMFSSFPQVQARVEPIARDFFVTAELPVRA